MKRAALYCRLSREDEGLEASAESESIQNQRSMLLAWADRLGYAVQGIYCDEDYSGADRDRPAFNRMLAAARAGQIDVILAKSQSRFTRDMELVEKYLHGLFPLWGVRFLALVDHVDTGDAAGKKSRQIYGLMNEWYLEDLSANVRAVLTHKRRQGCSIASSPLYGYQKDPARKGHLLPDESSAPVVERIFRLALSGLDKYMDGIYISEKMGANKPARRFFEGVLKDLGIKHREKVLVIGDSLKADVEGARNAGLAACWFCPGGFEKAPRPAPDHMVGDLRELYPIVMEEDELANVGSEHRKHQDLVGLPRP